MTDARGPGVVVDAMVVSWLLDEPPDTLGERNRAWWVPLVTSGVVSRGALLLHFLASEG
jgi:hypothetical protein